MNGSDNNDPHTPPPIQSDGQQRPVGMGIFILCMGVSVLAAGTIAYLSLASIALDQFGLWPRIFVMGVLAIFTLASLASTEIIPWTSKSLTEWQKPRVLGMIVYLFLGAASFVVGIANVFDPRLDRIGDALRIGEQPLITSKIGGTWGEPGCAVTYDFRLTGNSLVQRSVRTAPSLPRETIDYSVINSQDQFAAQGGPRSVMDTNQNSGRFDGLTVRFTYSTDGARETLQWQVLRKDVNTVELVRCEP